VHDPWLPASVLREQGLQPASLQDTLALSRFVFVLATVTDASRELIGAAELDLLPEGARLVLISRAAVVDYDALVERVAAGRFLAGVDVWPDEPLAADHPARLLEGMVLSPHRAGGIPQALLSIGDMVCDDLELIAAGLPPVRLQQAAPELVGRYRNRPVD
jgi:phosphoglycerate dehydrogenase-like enzyme